jgi:hypothetical protein
MFSRNLSLEKLHSDCHLKHQLSWKKNGTIENMDNYNIVRMYCSHEIPLFLPYYILEKLFSIEVARHYRFWLHLFHEKRKRKIIALPWRVGEILLRGTSKIDEFVVHLDQYNLEFIDKIRGFHPKHLFVDHMTSVGFSNALTNTFIFGVEEGNIHDPMVQFIDKRKDDIETIMSKIDRYK